MCPGGLKPLNAELNYKIATILSFRYIVIAFPLWTSPHLSRATSSVLNLPLTRAKLTLSSTIPLNLLRISISLSNIISIAIIIPLRLLYLDLDSPCRPQHRTYSLPNNPLLSSPLEIGIARLSSCGSLCGTLKRHLSKRCSCCFFRLRASHKNVYLTAPSW